MRGSYPAMLLACLLLMPLAPTAQEAVEGEAPITRDQADAILLELKEIRRLLELREPEPRTSPQPRRRPQPTSPANAEVSIEGRPVLGEPDAPVTMVEFVDYECPYCRRFFKGPYQKLKRDYIDPGMVRLVVVDMPLPFHRLARKAAQAAHCAGDQGRFWEMHDFLFGGSAGLTDGGLLAYAEQAKLDLEAFRACRDSDRHLERIDLDTSAARSAGITGTPAFIIGRSQGDRVSGPHIRGALPYRVFQGHIESLLEEAPEPL